MGAAVELTNENECEERIDQSEARIRYLSDVHHVVLVLEHRCLVVVDVQVVGGREDGYEGWETSGLTLPVHSISGVLGLVSSDD